MRYILLFLLSLFCFNISNAQMTVTTGGTATALAQAIAGPGIAVSNASINCATAGFGTFANGATGAGNIGITNGVLLTTGTATDAAGPEAGILGVNNTTYTGSSASDPDLTIIEPGAENNTCRLDFDLIPICGNLQINYVFASEEYPDYVCSSFNDAFGFFISGPGISGTQNMAIIPSTSIGVAINSINPGVAGNSGTAGGCTSLAYSSLYYNNTGGSQVAYGGFTLPLTASAVVQPCQTYHLKIVIADAGSFAGNPDYVYDSGVFLQQDGVSCPSSPVITINPAAPTICPGQSVSLTASGVAGPYTWSPATGLNTTTGATVTSTPPGTATYTVSAPNGCSGTITQTVTVTVSGTASPVITPAGPFCASAAATNLTVNTAGGTWSGTGITNAANGTFNPATAGVGTHVITYTIAGSCGGSTTANIVVNAVATPSITAAGPFCSSAAAVTLTGSPAGGTWAGTGITNTATGVFNPATAGNGTHAITYTVTGACGGVANANIVVSATANPTITPAGPFCSVGAAVTLTASPTGGTWSGTAITNAATGQFTPSSGTVGTNTVTYTVTGACGGTTNANITLTSPVTPSITAAGPFCTNAAPLNLSGSPAGGSWHGVGITDTINGTFNPATAGAGTHAITYVFYGACGATASTNIVVNAPTVPVITQAGPLCNNVAAVTLTASVAGGTWSGTGITSAAAGTFNPATATVGNNIITYTLTGCASFDTMTILVNPFVSATITQVAPKCANAAAVSLVAANPGGTWTGTGVTVGTNSFVPANATIGSNIITYSIGGACPSSDTMNIIVNALPVPDAGNAVSICSGTNTTLTCTPAGYNSYTWTPATGLTPASGLGQSMQAAPSATTLYTVTATNNGCSATDTVTVFVNALPVANFTADTVCLGTCTPFTNSSTISVGTNTYFWGFGDLANGTSSATSPCYTYGVAGTFSVTLVATFNGCSGIKTKSVVVLPQPIASFTKTNVCFGTSILFNNTSTSASSYLWNFGDLQTSTAVSPTHVYGAAGTFNVLLTASNLGFCSDTQSIVVNVYPIPVADFTATNECLNVANSFTDNSSVTAPDLINTYKLDFTTNNSIDDFTANPTNVYPSAGTYTVTHIVISNNNCVDTVIKTVNVFAIPNAQFTANTACQGAVTNFNNTSTVTPGTINSNNWIFNSGAATSNLLSPSFTYPASGNYWVYLTVGSTDNCFDTDSLFITVNPNPVVDFAAITPLAGCAPLCVSFNDLTTLTNVPVGNIVSLWNWDLGNGDVSSAQNPLSCYNSAGTFSVGLTVTSNNGCTSSYTISNYVTVYPDPIASFTADPAITSIFSPDVSFIDLSLGGQSTAWDFGDSTLASIINANENLHHLYTDTGTFIVTQIVTTEFGCVDTFKLKVIIQPDFAFYIPNAFTVNGDAKNDLFTGKGYGIKSYEMIIFDRWGNLIYKTNDLLNGGWNGKVKSGSETAPTDVYVYKVNIRDILDRPHQYIGGFTLLK